MPESYGIRIGANVATDSDAAVKLTSKYNALKVLKWGDATFNTDGSGNGSVTIPHGLGYAPAFHVFRKDTASWPALDASSYPNAYLPLGGFNYWASDDLHHALHHYADEDNLYIEADTAEPSKTMNFRYYVIADLSEDFSGDDELNLLEDFGFAATKSGIDVLTAQEYEKMISSKYKILQYHQALRLTQDITLPQMFASPVDTYVEEGTYVDFEHGLGYAPFFLCFFDGSISTVLKVPYNEVNSIDTPDFMVTGFSDATRVRISFWRSSTFFVSLLDNWPAETLNIRIVIFTENLASTPST